MKKILNLVHPEKSNIEFKPIKFPDGQQTIDITSISILNEPVTIESRLNSFKDLELIIAANQALINLGITDISLYVPYFLGSRSDRKFIQGGVHYLKQVICPIINSQNFKEVTVLDPHSDVLEACLNNFSKIDNSSLVRFALKDIDNKDFAETRICFVSPDAGAYKKVFELAQKTGIHKIITATKVRDIVSGKITHTEIPIQGHNEDVKYVIVDDICDGGRTFIELARAIQNQVPDAKIYLIVTHGIFSAGLLELSKWFEKIYTTNSYSDIKPEDHSDYTVNKDFLKQFNVFTK